MIIKLHQSSIKTLESTGEILVQAERISFVREYHEIDFITGKLLFIGSEITMNDCEYTKEGHKKKITIRVTESVSEIYQLIQFLNK